MFLSPTVENLLQEIHDNIRGRPSQEGPMFLTPYNAYSSKTSIANWIREAEEISELDSLSDDDLKEFIGSSLTGSALTWHIDRLKSHAAEDFSEWKAAIIARFQDHTVLQKQKIRFFALRQEKNQPTKQFVEEIKSLYHEIFGEKVADQELVQAETQAPEDPKKNLRESILLEVFMKGLHPTIKDAMWNGRLPPDYNWYQATQAAIDTEKLLISKEFSSEPTINSPSIVNSHLKLIVKKQQKQLEELRNLLSEASHYSQHFNHRGFASKNQDQWTNSGSPWKNPERPKNNQYPSRDLPKKKQLCHNLRFQSEHKGSVAAESQNPQKFQK